MIGWLFALLFMAFIMAVIYLLGIIRSRLSGIGSAYGQEERAKIAAQIQASQEDYKRKKPKGSAISSEEHTVFRAWLEKQERPAVRLQLIW